MHCIPLKATLPPALLPCSTASATSANHHVRPRAILSTPHSQSLGPIAAGPDNDQRLVLWEAWDPSLQGRALQSTTCPGLVAVPLSCLCDLRSEEADPDEEDGAGGQQQGQGLAQEKDFLTDDDWDDIVCELCLMHRRNNAGPSHGARLLAHWVGRGGAGGQAGGLGGWLGGLDQGVGGIAGFLVCDSIGWCVCVAHTGSEHARMPQRAEPETQSLHKIAEVCDLGTTGQLRPVTFGPCCSEVLDPLKALLHALHRS